MPKIVFFDINADKIDSYKKLLGNFKNTSFFHGSLDRVIEKYNVSVLISPANSFGVMTGGIDRDIAGKYPDVVKNVLNKVRQSTYKDSSGRHYIPVGMCEAVMLENSDINKCLLIAPTMFLPQNIVGTKNVAMAFRAILGKIKFLGNHIVVACPCLGTGVGGMSGEESATQIAYCLEHFL
jgi:O-acetyl-ADP-ribose deacetylase (regulator of RNase III)